MPNWNSRVKTGQDEGALVGLGREPALVLLALAENVSFSLVNSENKILSKEKKKRNKRNPFTNSTSGNCVSVS